MPKTKKDETAIVAAQEFGPLAVSNLEHTAQITEAMHENVGASIGLFDFDKIQVPAGGGTAWEVPTIEGPEPTKTLRCVILLAQDVRAYYSTKYEGENNPPDCASPDLQTGFGAPAGDCHKCPFAQWGSARRPDGKATRGQACSQRKHMLVLTEYGPIPYFMDLPPTSLKNLKRFMFRLAQANMRYYHALVEAELEKVEGGIAYSVARWAYVGPLSPEQRAVAEAFRASMRNIITAKIQTDASATPAQEVEPEEAPTEEVQPEPEPAES